MNITGTKVKLPEKSTVVVFVIWLIASAININKAFHIDDVFHLEAAQWIQQNPFKPMSGFINWENVSKPIYSFNQPPLYFYLLAFTGSIFGYTEVSLHLLQSVFTLLGLFYFHKLLCFYKESFAIAGTIFLGLGPAFLVNQNLMVDIPILSLSVVFIYLLVKDGNNTKVTSLYLAASVFSIGLLLKYTLLPLLLVLSFSVLRTKKLRSLPILLIPILTILAWTIFNYYEVGSSHMAGRPRNDLGITNLLSNSTSFLLTLGSITPFSLLFYEGLIRSRSIKFNTGVGVLVVIAVLGLYLWVFGFGINSFPHKLFWVMFLTNGILMLIAFTIAAKGTITSYPFQIVIIWVVAQASFIILLAPFMATRHVLLILPALIIICGYYYQHTSTVTLKASVTATVFLGLTLGISDWIYADFYRNTVHKALAFVPKQQKVWSVGHWGWQWYSKQAGMEFYEYKTSNVLEGDYIIMPSVVSKQQLEKSIKLEKKASVVYQPSVINFFTTANFASFYNTFPAQLPWYVSISSVDTVHVYTVQEVKKVGVESPPKKQKANCPDSVCL